MIHKDYISTFNRVFEDISGRPTWMTCSLIPLIYTNSTN